MLGFAPPSTAASQGAAKKILDLADDLARREMPSDDGPGNGGRPLLEARAPLSLGRRSAYPARRRPVRGAAPVIRHFRAIAPFVEDEGVRLKGGRGPG